jgi:DNA-binding IclR family transcriptional regulator
MKKTSTSSAVERALSILEIVAESDKGMTNADISRRLKIPKSSASYILRVLENRAYLRRNNDGKYLLGLQLMSLTSDIQLKMDVRDIAKPELYKFLKASGLSGAHLAILDNGRAVYIEKVEAPDHFIRMDIWVGHRLPVHTTAIGKVLVSHLPKSEIIEILKIRGMEKKTKKSITSTSKFLRGSAKVKDYGFAVDNEENSIGVRCVAAPVFNHRGRVVAALGTSATTLQIDDNNLSKIVDLIKKSANRVSRQLGYRDSEK